ncbi:MAG: glycosyltransferase, partial [Synergistaceae bacterium]|nr:glycosyltransferase [Synergistaceae bacterium]
MPPLISVVVPAYNSAGKIAVTLGSLIAQDYENLEIIAVNDASGDDTADVAREVLGNSSRPWKVIDHEVNRGVSVARNTGMDASRGEYLAFVDADDTVENDYISGLFRSIEATGGDVAVCGYKTLDEATGTVKVNRPSVDLMKLS